MTTKLFAITLILSVALLGTAFAKLDADRLFCNAILKNDRAEIQETVSVFWRDFDNWLISAEYYNWTTAEKAINANLFYDQYFASNASWIVDNNRFIGRQAIINAMIGVTFLDKGGRRANNGDIIKCNSLNDFSSIRDHVAVLRGVSAGPGTVSLLIMTTRTSVVRENVTSLFKVYEVYNEVIFGMPLATNQSKILPVRDSDFNNFN